MKKTNIVINIEPWVSVEFSWHPFGKYQDRQIEYSLNFPRSMLERVRWIIEWRHAKLICANPRVTHEIHWCFYDKKSGLDMGFGSLLSSISAHRGQITQWQNKIRKYENDRKMELFYDLDNDPHYQAALVKLNAKKAKLEKLLIELDKIKPQ